MLKISPVIQSFKRGQNKENNIAAPQQKTNNQTFNLVRPSMANLKANFAVNFKGAIKLTPSGNGIQLVSYEPSHPNLPFIAVTELSSKDFFNHPYYENTANDLAIIMGPDKNVIMTHEDDANSDLFIHKFTQNVEMGKYRRQGFIPGRTHVSIIDTKACLEKGTPLTYLSAVTSSYLKPKNTKEIIFIKNIDSFLLHTKTCGIDPTLLYKDGFGKEVQVIGLLSKDTYKAFTSVPQTNPEIGVIGKALKTFSKLELNGLTPAAARDLLKKDKRFIDPVLKKYKEVIVKISPNAIDALVDSTSTNIAGSFPEKALKVLDLAIAAKVNEAKLKDDYAPIIISNSDIKRFFDKHSNLLKSLKSEQEQFSIAENVKTKLSDVGGLNEDTKETLQDIIDFAKNPEKYKKLIGEAPKGILLTGSPGNGKTSIARGIAGEVGAPFIATSGSDLCGNIYQNSGSIAVNDFFDTLEQQALQSESHTAFGFVDEIDALGRNRGNSTSGEGDKTLNTFLTRIDGFNKNKNCNIILLFASNRPDIIDPALKRTGRIDRIIEIPNPDEKGRLEILKIHARNKPFESEAAKAEILENTAKITKDKSGSDLAETMKVAAKIVSKAILKGEKNRFITHEDISKAISLITDQTVKQVAMGFRH